MKKLHKKKPILKKCTCTVMSEIQRSNDIQISVIVITLLTGSVYNIVLFVNFEINDKSLHLKNGF